MRATADQLSTHSSTRSITNSSALTLDWPDTSLASTSIEIDRHASFIYLNNITLRQYLTDLTWLIAILHGVLFHTDFDQYHTDEEHQAARHRAYPQAVDAILYASTVTRPDLSQAAGVLFRFISKWTESHWKAAKHLLRYIRGTSDLLPLRQNLVTELPWVMQMQTGGVTWTLDALLRLCLRGLWRHCCVEKPASANCFVYYRSRVHGISRCSTTGYLA